MAEHFLESPNESLGVWLSDRWFHLWVHRSESSDSEGTRDLEKERFPPESLLGPNEAMKEGGIPNLALCLQICFVPNQHNGEIITVLDSEYLSEELAYLIETAREAGSVRPPQGGTCPVLSQVSHHLPSPLPVIDCKHQQEAVASTHVLLPHGTKFLLTCSVQDCRDRERNM